MIATVIQKVTRIDLEKAGPVHKHSRQIFAKRGLKKPLVMQIQHPSLAVLACLPSVPEPSNILSQVTGPSAGEEEEQISNSKSGLPTRHFLHR